MSHLSAPIPAGLIARGLNACPETAGALWTVSATPDGYVVHLPGRSFTLALLGPDDLQRHYPAYAGCSLVLLGDERLWFVDADGTTGTAPVAGITEAAWPLLRAA